MKKKSSRPDQVLYILFFGKNKKMTFGHGLFFLCRFPEFIFFPFPQSCPSLLPVWLFDYYWHVVDGWLESCDPNRSQGRSHFGRKSNPHHHHHQRKQADFVPSVIWEGNILFFKYKNKKNKKLVSAPSGSHSVTSCRRCVPKWRPRHGATRNNKRKTGYINKKKNYCAGKYKSVSAGNLKKKSAIDRLAFSVYRIGVRFVRFRAAMLLLLLVCHHHRHLKK